MPMSGDVMAAEAIAAMDAIDDGVESGDSKEVIQAKLAVYRRSLMQAMCNAIVLHIETNAIVSGPVVVTSATALTGGAPGVGVMTNGKVI